jgi:hypothetical protein
MFRPGIVVVSDRPDGQNELRNVAWLYLFTGRSILQAVFSFLSRSAKSALLPKAVRIFE